MGRVSGKVAFVTGAARGQGRSHALLLAEEGADIIAVDICEQTEFANYPLATADDLAETVALVEKLDRRIIARTADVRDRAALVSVVADGIAELGRLDIVVANAGLCPLGADLPAAAFLETVEVDLVGVINTISAALPHLGAGASIIATGSVASLVVGHTDSPTNGPGGAGYAHAKRAIVPLVRDLALALAPEMIRVNAVHPTNCDTGMLQSEPMYRLFRPDLEAPTREDAESAFASLQAMPNVPYISPREVSNAVLFLASDESRYVTGLQLKVDAGATLKQPNLS
ncbi:mycofactocin-coupled SDR family oxidoreductase [Parafrankia elaeagni]|uniref:mycofactocin-coupled SDR family oxidoreductase n=1 Tax=Parafrankia elaeagni TaxID=222534 RepID=UPI0003754852|nr:mycofactocin-coupled SDR family oxidoreductase [Parafrankia elaeagni]